MADTRGIAGVGAQDAQRPPNSLILIGYWDGPWAEPGWPDVTTFVDETWDADERADVLSYLRHGIYVVGFLGYSKCRFCGINNGNAELSDGVFIWPEGLSHYVAEHGVRLPDEFVQHTRDWSEAYEDARRALDTEWWRSHSTGAAERQSH